MDDSNFVLNSIMIYLKTLICVIKNISWAINITKGFLYFEL